MEDLNSPEKMSKGMQMHNLVRKPKGQTSKLTTGWNSLTTAEYPKNEAPEVVAAFDGMKQKLKANGMRTFSAKPSDIKGHKHYVSGLQDHAIHTAKIFEDEGFKNKYGKDITHEIVHNDEGHPFIAIHALENGRFHEAATTKKNPNPFMIYDPANGKVMVGPKYNKKSLEMLKIGVLTNLSGEYHSDHINNLSQPNHVPDSVLQLNEAKRKLLNPPLFDMTTTPPGWELEEKDHPIVMKHFMGDSHTHGREIMAEMEDAGLTTSKVELWKNFTDYDNIRQMRADMAAINERLHPKSPDGAKSLYMRTVNKKPVLRFETKTGGEIHHIDLDTNLNMNVPTGMDKLFKNSLKTGSRLKNILGHYGHMLSTTQFNQLGKFAVKIARRAPKKGEPGG